MGTTHTVQALADWKTPTMTQASSRSYIVEQDISGGTGPSSYDTPEQWAQVVNNLYEYLRPPLVQNVPASSHTITSTSYVDVAQYKSIHPLMIGTGKTGGDRPKCKLVLRASMVGGTATIRFAADGSGDSTTYTISAGAAFDWEQSGALYLSGTDFFDELLTVEAKVTAGTLLISSVEIHWDSSRTTLPDGKYLAHNDFIPCDPGNYGRYDPLSVERMQRLVKNLVYLYRCRTPGRINTTWLVSEAGKPPDLIIRPFLSKAYQKRGVHQAVVFLYGRTSGTADHVVVKLGNQTKEFHFASTTGSWQHQFMNFSTHEEESSIEHDLWVDYEGRANILLQGLCAYWMPIEGTF